MLYLAKNGEKEQVSLEECECMAQAVMENGSALKKLVDMVEAQHGDSSMIKNPNMFKKANYYYDVVAQHSGYVTHTDAQQIGIASMVLGAGRETKESSIDFAAGIALKKKTGDKVQVGDTIATLYTEMYDTIPKAEDILRNAYTIGATPVEQEKLIIARVTQDGVTWY